MRRFIRPLKDEEFVFATALAWRVFKRFEAPDYTDEGVENFYRFLTDDILYKMFLAGEYRMFACFEEGGTPGKKETMVGIVSLRERTHISLLFVEERCHRQGIATALLRYVDEFLYNGLGENKVTVNSSPYAVGFYHKFGFTDTEPETVKNGIRFTSMIHEITG
ncbi:MAG: GNAT family N-acetyltransferase [Lachnospiraceae bacterium]|nr:GNAT family N-acetyltransferase [Lachnospiraceae bacterium]